MNRAYLDGRAVKRFGRLFWFEKHIWYVWSPTNRRSPAVIVCGDLGTVFVVTALHQNAVVFDRWQVITGDTDPNEIGFCPRNSSNAGQEDKRPNSRTPRVPEQLMRLSELKLNLTIPVGPGFAVHTLIKDSLAPSPHCRRRSEPGPSCPYWAGRQHI